MKPRTKGAMGSIRDLLDKRPDPSTFPQSILYFNSRIETANALLALHEQFGLPITVDSPLARKFDAVRGELDKSEDIKDFEKGSFPFFSTTSALGLGIYWPGVRTVTQYGRTTVEDDIQRKGRGGRSGQRSIGITFWEPRKDARKKSAASNPEQDDTIPDEISTSSIHGDRLRLELLTGNELSIRFFYESKACLHALAIVLYTQGELPLKADDPLIVAEMERQGNITGRSCQCSRCDPQGAKYIIKHLRYATEESYHEFSSYDGATLEADKMSQPTQNSQVENAEDDLEDSADERTTQSVNRQTRGHNPWRMNSQQRDEFVKKLLLKYRQYTQGLNYGPTENLLWRFPPIIAQRVAKEIALLDSEDAFRLNDFTEPIPDMWKALFPVVREQRDFPDKMRLKRKRSERRKLGSKRGFSSSGRSWSRQS
ncbi:hypothetical protein MVLG_07154 [Microbotryum lychnidis-dioicae p1A1 Lamole]|uniref:Helicase C-terminal domain-containing protein n=1 Tax=Microbotryum lychnidis-dioicae (strain p1A1 Lamole / MvSl-1064) TaxID=683840 RepID=U5HJH2_USTV1|nr:hypothetical protein MVLG_07154 [Microbotryum lychnidis-dioicae p1A1 Lamole]|eukprot:KDE02278.1 hypothetical protein MVLG_07154 [Microbotryum lychnidis-dioicae p1A1 Lamole]